MDNLKPKTYWEERCFAAEGALERLFIITASALPHTYNEIVSVIGEWNRIRDEISEEHSRPKAG